MVMIDEIASERFVHYHQSNSIELDKMPTAALNAASANIGDNANGASAYNGSSRSEEVMVTCDYIVNLAFCNVRKNFKSNRLETAATSSVERD